jgi:hypothetical protein
MCNDDLSLVTLNFSMTGWLISIFCRVSDPDPYCFWKQDPVRILIRAKGWIRICIKVKIQDLSRLKNGAVEGRGRSEWRPEASLLFRPVVADSHHLDEDQEEDPDPDPH